MIPLGFQYQEIIVLGQKLRLKLKLKIDNWANVADRLASNHVCPIVSAT